MRNGAALENRLQGKFISIHTSPSSGGTVVGTAGNDALYRGKGDSTIDGLGGIDIFVVGGGFADNLIKFDRLAGRWSVGQGAGELTLRSIEALRFADTEVSLDDPVLWQPTQHLRTPGDDLLIGNDLGYALLGDAGNDTFTGNGGDDRLYGGKGDDTAVYRGLRADYDVERDPITGSYSVRDKIAGRDGNDTVNGIEHLRFADGTLDIDATLLPPPATPREFIGQLTDGPVAWATIAIVTGADALGWVGIAVEQEVSLTGIAIEALFVATVLP